MMSDRRRAFLLRQVHELLNAVTRESVVSRDLCPSCGRYHFADNDRQELYQQLTAALNKIGKCANAFDTLARNSKERRETSGHGPEK